MPQVFAPAVFFIVFRETLETVIIVSVLLSFLKQQLGPGSSSDYDDTFYRRLRKQVWVGTLSALVISLIMGIGFIAAFYTIGTNFFEKSEYIWEGVFCILASIIISVMGAALLRVSKLQSKWRVKLAKAFDTKHSDNRVASAGPKRAKLKLWAEKYALFVLPFITVLREALEAILFISGVSLSNPASAIPLPMIVGLLAGGIIGYLLYRVGNAAPLRIFLVASTAFLYIVAAGLFSRGVWYFEADAWNRATGGDAGENGSGPGSYDIRQSVWHVNCCNPEDEAKGGSGWGILNALFGWTNSATYGSVISYNLYWIVVIAVFALLRFKEKRAGYPFVKAKTCGAQNEVTDVKASSDDESSRASHSADAEKGVSSVAVRENHIGRA